MTQPLLEQEDATVEGVFMLEKPVTLKCEKVLFPDGTPLKPEQAAEAGFLVYRNLPGGIVHVWDEEETAWVAPETSPKSQPLPYMEDAWQMPVIASGAKDVDKADKFSVSTDGALPSYFMKCIFKGIDTDGMEHQSTVSQTSTFIFSSVMEAGRAGLKIDSESPADAKKIWVYLKDPAFVERGTMTIRKQGSGYEIELLANSVSILLKENGDIVLSPKAGGHVRIDGGLIINGDLTVGNDLSVTGDARLSSIQALGGTLKIQGNVKIDGNIEADNLGSP